MPVRLVPVVPEHTPLFAELHTAEREHLRRTSPARSAAFATPAGQLDRFDRIHSAGGAAFGIWEDELLVGELALTNVVRGPLQSANLSYWIRRNAQGRGLATAAVDLGLRHAFTQLELHRLEAGTRVDNLASQRVLEKNGFERIGLARQYLLLDGVWTDHVLFQRISPTQEARSEPAIL